MDDRATHDRSLRSLYARLQARHPERADAALAYRIARGLGDDAQLLSAGLARSNSARRSGGQAAARPAFGWALAAAMALVAVFAGRQLIQDEALPGAPAPDPRSMIADAPSPLFSGSFEPDRHGNESIFDSDFGS